MVVLVPRECGSTGKGLLAIRKWTLVRAFARVDAPMPGERARIAEWL